MTNTITFTLDGKEVEAGPDETIWQVARREGTTIPHLCWLDKPGYRADGNCRACMVEIDGERTLAASCIRKPSEGMVVKAASDRAKAAQKMVVELLVADQPPQDKAHDQLASFWKWADVHEVSRSRFP
ncbi:MAG: 2Fe-2S iron-sulfur cluster-binding protein, partial [Hyphomicrobiaceae bacterium]